MKKLIMTLCGLLFPSILLAADSSLSFSPPPGDFSVVFLGNIFGIVDGVLHGTGSQIMGTMFGVFNSAVLAIGGLIIMYTLIVSTMNTAQEGQMLGQKWSSIWVPLRSTLGLALLIPKASGYCLMQIFVMWIVIQGVGAADKVWEAALSYLNRGGVIVQAQMNPVSQLLGKGADSEIVNGASKILSGQVCMLGLQTILQNQRQVYLSSKQNNSGACSGSPSPQMQTFCENTVPDFLSTVNAVTTQTNISSTSKTPVQSFTLSMPNFPIDSPYHPLNGICGSIYWNAFTGANTLTNITLTSGELQTAQMSRAIAIQQMYLDLSSIAQIIVNNAPALNAQQKQQNTSQNNAFSVNAQQQFGVPLYSTNQYCSSPTASSPCVGWGQDPSGTSAPLFNGTEVQGAITDYNGIMLPTLNLVNQSTQNKNAQAERQFISTANQQGWILAGSYFFNLAQLNSASSTNANLTDSGTGLTTSSFDTTPLGAAFNDSSCGTNFSEICTWLNNDNSKIMALIGLINGSNVGTPLTLPIPKSVGVGGSSGFSPQSGAYSSTVYGFFNNSMVMQLPGQPGMQAPPFNMSININISPGTFALQSQNFSCGKVLFSCVGSMLGNLFYNDIFKNMFNYFLSIMAQAVNSVIMSFLALPLIGMSQIFKTGVSLIQQPSVNPVVALANMGVAYINFANDLWFLLIEMAVMAAIIPVFGLFIFALMGMALPLLFAWMSVMLSVGFVTAYYIPFLPYMIFTFGSIAWLMVVIEAMVAAPIVALGVTHPEGHEAFGKGEQAIMILLNVFLRPAMMIIGYIAAIALSYVSVWIINAGFSNAASFIQGSSNSAGVNYSSSGTISSTNVQNLAGQINMSQGYTGWAGIYGFFFSILIYTTMYLVVVQKSFTLITYLPDKVLRWIGGQAETAGQEATQWGDESKQQIQKGQEETSRASGQLSSQMGGMAQKGLKAGFDKATSQGAQVKASPGNTPESTPEAEG